MRLSEAIREGAKLGPQGFGLFALVQPDGTVRYCALGGAAVFAFGRVEGIEEEDLFEQFPALSERVPYPAEGEYAGGKFSLRASIVMLNDGTGWTREAIADWVETVEAEAGL